MAEKTEKAAKKRAPAKPRAAAGTRKAATKKTDGVATETNGAVPATVAICVPTHEEIAILALKYWEERGRTHGQHMQDWLRAEQDLVKMAS